MRDYWIIKNNHNEYYSFTDPYRADGEPKFTTNISNAHFYLSHDEANAGLERIRAHGIKGFKVVKY